MIAEESYDHEQTPRTLLRGQRVDDDETAPQDQRTSHRHDDEVRLVEVVWQMPLLEGQYGADEHQKKIVHQKEDHSTRPPDRCRGTIV